MQSSVCVNDVYAHILAHISVCMQRVSYELWIFCMKGEHQIAPIKITMAPYILRTGTYG